MNQSDILPSKLEQTNCDEQYDETNDTFVSFALIGLGLTVRIRSGLYHYFFASIFTHCTPLVVTVRDERVYMSTNNLNVVGWGASSATGRTSFKKQAQKRKYTL